MKSPTPLSPNTTQHEELSRSTTDSLVRSLKVLLSLTRSQLAIFIAGLCALALGSAINLLLPEMVRRILDPERFEWITANLATVVLGLCVLFLTQGTAFFVRSYLFGLVGQRVYADLRERLFRSVLLKDITFFDSNRASDLAARINSDAALVQDAVSVKFSVIIRYGLQVVLGVVLMLFMSWKLTVAIVASVLVLVGGSLLFVSRLRAASRQYQDALARFTSFASEAFGGVKIVRALGALDQLARRAKTFNTDARVFGERRMLWGAGFSSGASAVLNILLVCVAWYGVTLVMGGELPLNELAAFVLYGAIVAVSFSFLIGAYSDLVQGLGGLERVLHLVGSEETALDVDGQERAAEYKQIGATLTAADVVFDSVTFAYPSRPDQPALQGLSCAIADGSFTAFVGPSGSGKSSLVQLLCRLYEPQEGRITLGGVPLHKLDDTTLREQVAWVPQEPTLFGFTVLENLLLGNSEILRDEALKILRGWDFLDFIDTLECGYDTLLGEFGTLLSGGQRQRLAIARALLRKPGILVLDEATSGLDSETEGQVLHAIRRYLPQATLVVISHRLSTVKEAEVIYVLNEGVVAESGTHAELTRGSGLYRQYVERQTLI